MLKYQCHISRIRRNLKSAAELRSRTFGIVCLDTKGDATTLHCGVASHVVYGVTQQYNARTRNFIACAIIRQDSASEIFTMRRGAS